MASTTDLSQPLIRRGPLLATGMVLVLAAFGQAASAQTVNKGTLELQFGTSASKVVLILPDGSVSSTQELLPQRKNDCRLSSTSTTGGLLDFSATTQGSAAPVVGLVSGSMGVYSGSSGVPCSRFETNETLTVALGKVFTQDKVVGDNTVFNRLVLDIETKKSLSVDLEVLVADGSGGFAVFDTYTLRSGSSVIPGQGLPDEPGSKIFNCNSQSDSGPDAGALDNCIWEIHALGHGFRLRPTAGEGSLEGGSDTKVFSQIFLTEAVVGVFGCDADTSTTPRLFGDDPQNPGSCQVTRVGVPAQACKPVGYILRNLTGGDEGQGCELLKAPGEQLVAYIDITFPVEPRTDIGIEPLTTIAFTGGNQSFEPNRCRGTVVADDKSTAVVEGWTIAEVLGSPRPWYVVDQSLGTNLDWACILDNSEWYVGNESMQISQTILFWGDIAFSRQ